MSYRSDTDLEFLATISKEDLKNLARVITHDKDGCIRLGQSLSDISSTKKDYWKDVAEQIQTYGANTVMTIFRFGEGVKYRKVLKDVCDKLKVNYESSNSTATLEGQLLNKILKDSWEKMTEEERRKMLQSVKFSCDKQMLAGAGVTALSSLLTTSTIMAFRLATMLTYSVVGSLGSIASATAASFIIGRSAGWLLGPLGWGLTVLSLAGPAYRVTIPACATVALLRKKYKLTPAERLRLEKADQLIKEQAKDIEAFRKDDEKCIAMYVYSYKIQERINELDEDFIKSFVIADSGVFNRNKNKINSMTSTFSFIDAVKNCQKHNFSINNLKERLELIIGCHDVIKSAKEGLINELEECFGIKNNTKTNITINILATTKRNTVEDRMRISFHIYCRIINKELGINPHYDSSTEIFKKLSLYASNMSEIESNIKTMTFMDALMYAYSCGNDKNRLYGAFKQWFITTHGDKKRLIELKSEFDNFWKFEV